MIDAIESELTAAAALAARGQFPDSFRHLERAHILSQSSTWQHVRVHYRMLRWAIARKDIREMLGQLLRIIGAATKTAFGLVPPGNTGGSNVGPFRAMPVPEDLKALLPPPRPGARAAGIGGLLAMLAVTVALVTQHHPSRPRTVLLDGRRVAFRVEGHGPPIILIPGLGNGMAAFDAVARDLGKTNTVIRYDRAGYGDSEPRPGPHDAAAAERELAGVLAVSGVSGPYILAGHSLGGLYAEYFAARHPEQVSALILAESRPSGFTARCRAAGRSDCVPPAWALWLSLKAARQEANALGRTAAQVQAAQPLQGKPVLVLSKAAGGNAFDRLWANEQLFLAARYPGSRHLVAPVSSHNIQEDARDWFVTSVRAFAAKTGDKR